MSAGCNGGPSEAIPGSAVRLIIGPALVSTILGALARPFAPVAALIDGFAVELTTLCGHDPPAMPVWDANDALILALGSESPFYQQTLSKIDDLIQNWAWDKSCQCTGGVTGPPLLAPAPPPGASQVNPTSNQPCFVGQYSGAPPLNIDSALNHDLDISSTTLSNDGRIRTGDTHSTSGNIYGMPSGTTRIDWTGFDPDTTSGSGSKGAYSFGLYFFDSTGAELLFQAIGPLSQTSGGTYAAFHVVPANTSYWLMIGRTSTAHDGSTPLEPPRLNTQVWCGGGAPGGQESCCPPDPSLTLGIQTIINMLQQLQPSAKAYTKGTVHQNLSGTGTLTVSGLFGLQIVLLTGIPTAIQFPGVPPYERSVGWMSILTGDGMIDEIRITRQHQVWASALAPYATQVGFQLNPGFSMQLTELLPA